MTNTEKEQLVTELLIHFAMLDESLSPEEIYLKIEEILEQNG